MFRKAVSFISVTVLKRYYCVRETICPGIFLVGFSSINCIFLFVQIISDESLLTVPFKYRSISSRTYHVLNSSV